MSFDVDPTSFVLVIDDKPDELRNGVRTEWSGRVRFEVLHPAEVEVRHLNAADLVLVDYKLKYWDELESIKHVSCRPANGLALAALLRECVDQSRGGRPTAFALHTGHLHEAKGRLNVVEASARHIVARFNNLEWVFPKSDDRRYDQMLLLADATRQLPSVWPRDSDDSARRARTLLDMDEDVLWFNRCWREVRECQPPIHELAGGSRGILFVRWLLHQIIPYPCFLWDIYWVAARFRLPVDVLRDVVATNSDLAEDLRAARYNGILAGFLGDRWWRGALEDYVWSLCEGDIASLGARLNERAGEDLGGIELDQPVVCLGSDLQPSATLVSAGDAVHVRPDQWPAFADSARMDIETVIDDPALRAIVDPLEDYRLPDAEHE